MKTIIIDVDNHRHDGELVPPGARLEVSAQTAAWMVDRKKAHYEAAVAASPETSKKDK